MGTIISLHISRGGCSPCLESLPDAPLMGPLSRLQGHQLGATLHQYFTLLSQGNPRWKSHGRDVSPPHPAACLQSSHFPTPCPSFEVRARSYLSQPTKQGHGKIVTVTLRIFKSCCSDAQRKGDMTNSGGELWATSGAQDRRNSNTKNIIKSI